MSTYVVINTAEHSDKRWLRHSSWTFTAKDNIAPIFVNELPDAIHSLSVAFARTEQGFALVALLGLRPEENLLVSEDGKWLGDYIPLVYRTRPFQLLTIPNGGGQQALCIEESSLSEGQIGEPIYDQEGGVTEVVGEILKLLTHYNTTLGLTQKICHELDQHGLITEWEINVNDGVTEQQFKGLYKIDETALNKLSNEALLHLREAAALPVIYAQLFSMNRIHTISDLLIKKTHSNYKTSPQIKEAGTFSFAGL